MPMNEEQQFFEHLKGIDNLLAKAEKELKEYVQIGQQEKYASYEEYREWAKRAPYHYAATEQFVNDTLADIGKEIGASASLKKVAVYDSFYVAIGDKVEGPYTREQILAMPNPNALMVSPVGVQPTTWDTFLSFQTTEYLPSEQPSQEPMFAAASAPAPFTASVMERPEGMFDPEEIETTAFVLFQKEFEELSEEERNKVLEAVRAKYMIANKGINMKKKAGQDAASIRQAFEDGMITEEEMNSKLAALNKSSTPEYVQLWKKPLSESLKDYYLEKTLLSQEEGRVFMSDSVEADPDSAYGIVEEYWGNHHTSNKTTLVNKEEFDASEAQPYPDGDKPRYTFNIEQSQNASIQKVARGGVPPQLADFPNYDAYHKAHVEWIKMNPDEIGHEDKMPTTEELLKRRIDKRKAFYGGFKKEASQEVDMFGTKFTVKSWAPGRPKALSEGEEFPRDRGGRPTAIPEVDTIESLRAWIEHADLNGFLTLEGNETIEELRAAKAAIMEGNELPPRIQ